MYIEQKTKSELMLKNVCELDFYSTLKPRNGMFDVLPCPIGERRGNTARKHGRPNLHRTSRYSSTTAVDETCSYHVRLRKGPPSWNLPRPSFLPAQAARRRGSWMMDGWVLRPEGDTRVCSRERHVMQISFPVMLLGLTLCCHTR